MRVGVKACDTEATTGGGATLQNAILNALSSVPNPYEIVALRHASGANQRDSFVHKVARRSPHFVRRLAGLKSQRALEEQAILRLGLDCLWYLHPMERPVPIPYIATVWDLAHRRLPLFPEVSNTGLKWQGRESTYSSLLPQACRVLTGTSAGKNEIVTYYGVPPENVRVVPFPVEGRFRNPTAPMDNVRLKYGIKGRFIFYPAQFWPHKNHVNLLFALRRYNDNHADRLHLVLTGSDKGNLAHVMSIAHQLELSAFVHHLGFVSHDDLAALYAQSEALIFPTFFGPDNIPPLEAFATRCPVAASRVQGAEEQLGDAAILFNPADPDDMAEAITRVVDDPHKRSELIDRGLRRVANLTPENYVKGVFEVLDEIEPMRRCWGKTYPHQ